MTGICVGRVAIVTGAGRGIGRAHALELAREGASVVVNDVGCAPDGSGADASAAYAVAREITAAGGTAVANTDDVADWDGAHQLVEQAVTEFGRLDVLVNNAGILRDRMLVSMSPREWDDVIRVHLRGTFAPTHFAAHHWRARAKETGAPTNARLINTSSAAGLYGNAGQANYAAAKAGIATFTVVASLELGRYGVTANAVAPAAFTRLTEPLFTADRDGFGPEQVSSLVTWLAGPDSSAVTGRVFDVGGGTIGVAQMWRPGPTVRKPRGWSVAELGAVIPELVEKAAPNVDIVAVSAQAVG